MTARPSVLIVDDQPANVQVLAAVLRDDYEVFFATDGTRALALATERVPDVVLLDVMMPGMDGFEVCRRLKQDERTREVPVVFVTSLGEVEDETRGFEVGGVDYIAKPISPPVVRARVRTHVDLHAARRRLARQNELLAENLALKEHVDRISRHDLRTPITGILGAAQLLLDDPAVGADRRELLEIIERSGYRLLDMVNLSLGLYHMEKGTYDLQPTRVDLGDVLRRVLRELSRIAVLRGVEPRIEPAGASATVWGEDVLCHALLGNLVKNAVEAAPHGTVVRIGLVASGDEVIVRVHNEGAVPLAIRPRFFEKYTTSGKKGGTGLGTYSARLMAETQRGRVRMTTSEDEGTTLEVALPTPPAGHGGALRSGAAAVGGSSAQD